MARSPATTMVVTSLAAMLLFGSCNGSTERNRAACEQGIYQFHYWLDMEQYHAIYAEVEEEFRRASTEESFVALLQTIHEKLGHVQDSRLRLIQMNWSAEYGESVRVLQETKFTKGKAVEHFFWRIRDNRASLIGYFIDSDMLKGAPKNGNPTVQP